MTDSSGNGLTGSTVLDAAKPPAEWCEIIAARGIHISERSLKEKARRLGACRVIGRSMLITPADIDLILEASRPSPKGSSAIAAQIQQGERATERALERLHSIIAEGKAERRRELEGHRKRPSN